MLSVLQKAIRPVSRSRDIGRPRVVVDPGMRQGRRPKPTMDGPEKSDSPIVAVKPANEAARAAEEQVEPRGGIKENADQQTTVRTQSREAVSHAQSRIREAVTRNRTQPLTTLLHHVSVDVLRAGFLGLKKTAAPGVDGLTWTQYEEDLEANRSITAVHRDIKKIFIYRRVPSRFVLELILARSPA